MPPTSDRVRLHAAGLAGTVTLAAGSRPAAAAGDGWTITGLAVPWETPIDHLFRLRFRRNSFDPATLAGLPLLAGHRDPLGLILAAEDSDAGPVITARLSRTAEGESWRTWISDGAVGGLSVGVVFDEVAWLDPPAEDGTVLEVIKATVREVSATPVPAAPEARITAIMERPMPPTPTPPPFSLELDTTAAEIAELRAQIDALSAQQRTDTPAAHPLSRFASAGEWALAVLAGTAAEGEQFAWVDQISPDNSTLLRPAWLDQWKGHWDVTLPLTTLFGTTALPPDGMAIEWPIDTVDPAGLVGEQTTEKTEVTSVKVSFNQKGSAQVRTYAGGSDVSWQLLQRSSPSYRDRYVGKLVQAAGLALESKLATTVAAATADPVTIPTNLNTASLQDLLIGASLTVQDATGAPAGFVVAGRAAFRKLASAVGVYPEGYGQVAPAAGTATASTLRVSLSGLPIAYAPRLDADTAYVTNREALTVWAGPVTAADAPNVPKLGTDMAVYRYAAIATHYGDGIVPLTLTPTP